MGAEHLCSWGLTSLEGLPAGLGIQKFQSLWLDLFLQGDTALTRYYTIYHTDWDIFFFNKFIYLFILAVLGLRFCARDFSSCGERGSLFIAVRGPLTIAAFPVAEHRLQTRRLSSCGSRAQSLLGMWDLPRPGLEPVSPALAGRPSTTAPPGKPQTGTFLKIKEINKNN